MKECYPISVILPIYNEEGSIGKVVQEISDYFVIHEKFKNYEIIVVEDGSSDNSCRILNQLSNKISFLKIITHHKNLGYAKALVSGCKAAAYPWVFFMDADAQFEIKEIEKMIPYIGDIDIIMGYRSKRADGWHRIILGEVYRWLVFLLFGLQFKDINCGFKLFKKETLSLESSNSRGGTFYTEILLKAKDRGLQLKEIAVEHFPRTHGKESGCSPKVIFEAFIDLIKLRCYRCVSLSTK
jgi:glycosyltransferase involved in cell wall biosynthesis